MNHAIIALIAALTVGASTSGAQQWSWSTLQVPNKAAVEAWRALQHRVPDLPFAHQDPEPDPLSETEVKEQTQLLYYRLLEIKKRRKLTEDDLQGAWELIAACRRLPDSFTAKKDVYDTLLGLDGLPPLASMEIRRNMGQYHYFNGHHAVAKELFEEAMSVDRSGMTEMQREIYYRQMASLNYVSGLNLAESGTPAEVARHYQRVIDDPNLLEYVAAVTKLSIYERLGNACYNEKQWDRAAKAFAAGLELLDTTPDQEHRYRVDLEIGKVKAEAMREGEGKVDPKLLFDEFAEVKNRLQDKGLPDFYDVLRALIMASHELQDREHYVETLQDARDWFVRKHKLTKTWERGDRETYLQASTLLIRHWIEQDQEKEALDVMRDTKQRAEVPSESSFWNLFPEKLRRQVLEKSVLDKQREPGK